MCPCPSTIAPALGVMKTVLVDPLLFNITILSLSEPCPGVEKIFFKKYINFILFYPKLPPLGTGWDEGLTIFTISDLFTLHVLHAKFGQIGLVVLEKKILTDNRR